MKITLEISEEEKDALLERALNDAVTTLTSRAEEDLKRRVAREVSSQVMTALQNRIRDAVLARYDNETMISSILDRLMNQDGYDSIRYHLREILFEAKKEIKDSLISRALKMLATEESA